MKLRGGLVSFTLDGMSVISLKNKPRSKYIHSTSLTYAKSAHSHYHAWDQAWKQNDLGPCITRQHKPSCSGQPMRLFTRNGVGIFEVYVLHMLTIKDQYGGVPSKL